MWKCAAWNETNGTFQLVINFQIKPFHYRRKFRSQTSDNMDRWKAEMGRVRGKRRVEERRSEKRKSQKKEDADARKGRKVVKHCVFPMICGSGGSKSTPAKAAGAEPSGQMRDEQLHAVVARSTFRSQNVNKAHQLRTTFGSWDVEKVHAVVARSTFPSQNVQSTPGSDHFWKLRCRKSARRCGAKHISKSKCTKHTRFGPLLEAEMSKKCTPLWREAHFQVKMYKAHQVRTTFGGSDVVSRGRRKGLCTLSKVRKTWRFCSIFNYNHHYTTLHSNTLRHNYNYTFTTFHYTTLHSTTLHSTTLHYTTLHSITISYTTLHYTTLHYTTLQITTLHHTTPHHTTLHYTISIIHYTTNHYTTLHYTTLHSTTLQYTTPHYTKLHYITLHYTTFNYATLHYTTLHYITLHYTTFNYTTLNYTTLHSTTLHYNYTHYIPLHYTTIHYTTLRYTTLTTTTSTTTTTTLH